MSTTLPPMVRGYLEAALWASTDENGDPLDDGRDLGDFAPSAIELASTVCALFVAENADDCAAYREERAFDPSQGTVDAYLGHDLWLTRNHHGAGFWDRGLGALGDRLTAAAEAMGSCDCYVGDDGQVYFS